MARGGLSSDPEKRARQIAGLASANSRVAERVAAGELDRYQPPDLGAPAPKPVAEPLPAGDPGHVGGIPVRRLGATPPPPRKPATNPGESLVPDEQPPAAPANPAPEPAPRSRSFWDALIRG